MSHIRRCLTLLLITACLSSGASGDSSVKVGGDVFSSGASATFSMDAPRDVFVSGFNSHLKGDVAQDAHVAGFNVTVSGSTGGDLYVAGFNLTLDGPVREDLTAAAMTMTLGEDSRVGGNARIAAGTIDLQSPINGSLVASGGTITLDAAIDGDVQLAAAELVFGDRASIGGNLRYTAPEKIDIPASIIVPERVQYEPWSGSSVIRDVQGTVEDSMPQLWPTLVARVSAVMILLFFLLIVAAVFLAFAPVAIEKLRQRTREHAWLALIYGFIGLSALVGALPVSFITIVGIPFAPIVLLLLVSLWTLGYILGVHVVASGVWVSFGGVPNSTLSKLVVLAVGLVTIAVLNFIPLIGWWINLAVMLLGLGAMTYAAMERLTTDRAARQH